MSGITILDDVVFPSNVLLAALNGSAGRQNDRTKNQGGYATANAVRDWTMRSWQIAVRPLFLSDVQSVIAINEVTDYGVFGFLLEDPIDSGVTVAQGALIGYVAGVQSGVSGFGNGTPNYSLQKVYTARGSTRSRPRDITRPNGTPALRRGGSPVTEGTGAGNASFTAGPVKVAFVPDVTRTVSSITVGATTQVVLSSAITGLVTTTGKLWLQGVGGADAALLNNLPHTITAISGATYTLATNTAGKTITASSGQGHKYPQPDEALTWSGKYYVPVQFRDDLIEWELEAAGSPGVRMVTVPATWLDEVREA